MIPGVDSSSILFNHRSFRKASCLPEGSDGFLERRIPGKNGEVSPKTIGFLLASPELPTKREFTVFRNSQFLGALHTVWMTC